MINSLSIIIPVFNEEKRLFENLEKIKKFISYRKIKKKEFILVDDGSKDFSKRIIQNFIKKNSKKNAIRLISYKKNQGKGAALKRGVLAAKNNWILTSDIDFSVSLFQLNIWINKKLIKFKKNSEVYFGSRANHKSDVESKIYRKFIGFILSKLIFYLLKIKTKDTQCGFKLYKKKVAKRVFAKMKSKGFEHDIEITILLKKNNIEIVELPVKWVHKEFSKVNLIKDSIRIFKSIFYFRKIYLI